jgi:hypothetical protein
MITATNTSAAQALKRDFCNIMAAKAGAYLKPRSNFLMRVIAKDAIDGEVLQRLIYGFSYKTMRFTKLVEVGGTAFYGATLRQIEEDRPGEFILHMGNQGPEFNTMYININNRTYEDMSFLDIDDDLLIEISFTDSDVYDGGDDDDGGNWTYHDQNNPNGDDDGDEAELL